MRVVVATGYYPPERMGGAEYQTLIMAQGLVELGHDVTFLATDTDNAGEVTAGGMTVRKILGSRAVGWATHRELVERAIQGATPDVCYVRRFRELGAAVPFCNDAGIPVISMSCHVMETSPFFRSRYPEEAMAHLRSFLSIRSADVHVCNTKFLQKKTQRWFPRKSIRAIYNGQPVPMLASVHAEPSGQVIWVNNLKDWKRPDLLVELARRLPQFRFVMVGRMAGGRYGEKMRQMLQQASANLEYLGPKPIEEVNALISQSDLLLYTSLAVEGFANSFLQAWFRGVPTLSLFFDIDGIIEREGIGRYSRTFEQLVADVQELMEDGVARREMGQRARQYAVSHHSAKKMVADYETLFEEIAGRAVRTGAK
ncbi:glycosyltransferase family 4 protein [Chloroflexota bacterium]